MSKFLANFRKDASKLSGVTLDLVDPEFWIDLGNYTINKVISGGYTRGLPQGRLSALAGPSAAGKSFVASNVAKWALDANVGVLYIDTENAIDKGYFSAIGIDEDNPLLQYASVSTISDTIKVIQTFLKLYRKLEETQPFIIIIDSLDMLQTDSEADNYDTGIIKGDQGQQAKQLKKMLGAFVQDIKRMPIHILCTKQVYKNQDSYTNKQEPYIFTDSIKFAFSQIIVVTRLLLKDKSTSTFEGIRMKVFAMKTRFTKPYQNCMIEVPYDTGMDRFTGTIEAGVAIGIIEKNGGWYTFNGEKFQEKAYFSDAKESLREAVLAELIKQEHRLLDVDVEDILDAVEDDSENETPADVNKRRKSAGDE